MNVVVDYSTVLIYISCPLTFHEEIHTDHFKKHSEQEATVKRPSKTQGTVDPESTAE